MVFVWKYTNPAATFLLRQATETHHHVYCVTFKFILSHSGQKLSFFPLGVKMSQDQETLSYQFLRCHMLQTFGEKLFGFLTKAF